MEQAKMYKYIFAMLLLVVIQQTKVTSLSLPEEPTEEQVAACQSVKDELYEMAPTYEERINLVKLVVWKNVIVL